MTLRILRLAVLILSALGCTGSHSTSEKRNNVGQQAHRKAQLVAIDVYGARNLTAEQMLAVCGTELSELAAALIHSKQVDPEPTLNKIRALGDFVDVTPALVGYPSDNGTTYYLTIDIVEREDSERRLNFREIPSRPLGDPADLISNWRSYESTVMEMIALGTMTSARVSCPAYHCLGDHRNSRVRTLASRMFELAPRHAQELRSIALGDSDRAHRAAAAFLVAMTRDVQAMLTTLSLAMRDPDAVVRNNSMRVLYEMAKYHRDIDIPIDAVLDALDFPSTTDRNKAAAILDAILQKWPRVDANIAKKILTRSGDALLAMLRLKQPNNHLFAHSILVKLAGRDLGETNYPAWDAWKSSMLTE